MQLQYLPDYPLFFRSKIRQNSFSFLLLAFSLLIAGCANPVPTLDPQPKKPYAGITLTVAFSSNIRHPELFRQHTREWSARSGAAVEFVETGNSDIRILPPAELPLAAESRNAAEVPASVRTREQKYQWDGLADIYADKLSKWNTSIVGLPLIGEGHVLIYRKETFGAVAPPATWERFVELADRFHKQSGKPSLAPLPKRPEDLDTEFYTIAASYDRMERNQTDQSQVVLDEQEVDRLLSFQYRMATLTPRIQSTAFVQALSIMQRMQAHRPAGSADDPVAAFRDGSAVLGVVTLEDLAHLQAADSPVRGKFGIAAIPGSEKIYDIDGTEINNKAEAVNRIPYVGWGGWLGVVTRSCTERQPEAAEAAWDLLVDFADPEKTGAENIIAARWGAGPVRLKATDQRFRNLWLGYNLSPGETDQLMAVLRQNLAPTVVNYRTRLRLPNQEAHLKILTEELRQGLTQAPAAKPEDVLNRAAQRWEQLWEGIPAESKHDWMRFGLGLSR